MAAKKAVVIVEPVKPMKLPPELRGVPNGELSPALLHRIRGGGRLFVDAAKKFNEMFDAAKAAKIDLVNQGDYRSYAAQKALFLDRYQRTPSGRKPQITRTWNGSTWYLKQGKAPCATPGHSNHGWGLAIDLDTTQAKTFRWLCRNAPKYGFYLQGAKIVNGKPNPEYEPWHWQYVEG